MTSSEQPVAADGAPRPEAKPPDGAPRATPLSSEELLARLAGQHGAAARYRSKGEVARGGMGAILRIHDEILGRDLAMKVILVQDEGASSAAELSQTRPEVLARFLEEAQVTGQLDHPGIVPVHEIGLDDQGRVYFTMRLVAGRDLSEIFLLVRTGEEGWNLTRAVGVLLKVCEATAFAHEKHVIHRDLKPANVMVGRFGEVYVMDWGLAHVATRGREHTATLSGKHRPATAVLTLRRSQASIDGASPLQTQDGDVIGTPAYMSPEQARGELDRLGPPTDVYSVGSILYELLAGHAPYKEPGARITAIDVWRKACKEGPTDIGARAPEAPPELVAICRKAMAREVGQRYAHMGELADELRAYLEGRVVRAYERGLAAELRKWIRRNKALAGTIAFATVALLGSLSVHQFLLSKKNEELQVANAASRAAQLEAERNEKLAREQKQIAEERATRILRLSDIKRVEQLEGSAGALWPAIPENVPRYEQWLTEADDALGRLGAHRAALEGLRAQAGPGLAFASVDDRWLHDVQEELVRRLEALAAPERGLRADVGRRLELARRVEEETLTGETARALWREACAAIADPARSPLYGGLVLKPQLGLLPLGADPRSGLWEFAHVQTGAVPARDAATGELRFDVASAIVFVLVPPGTGWIGAQSESEDGRHYDPDAEQREGPVSEVDLSAYFLSKYEVTQAQWKRLAGSNPSIYAPSEQLIGVTELDPVEQVSWFEAREVLGHFGLDLPTEVQWEYAARAGTDTPWWTGEERESLAGAANIADASAAALGANWPGIAEWPGFEDGFGVHGPVNLLKPNPWGFYAIHGNVWEWCRDALGSYEEPVLPGNGERIASDPRYRMTRGGSFYHSARWARSACRNNPAPETRSNHLGVRPVREVAQ
jgi:formylglycine-generating enzyme required for sulfatase activity/serine/threonine protein kinase